MKNKKLVRKPVDNDSQKTDPIRKKRDVEKNPDKHIDQDFSGYPHAPGSEELINPKTKEEKNSPACPLWRDESSLGVILVMIFKASASKAFIFTKQFSEFPPKALTKNPCLLNTADNTNTPLFVASKWVNQVLIQPLLLYQITH